MVFRSSGARLRSMRGLKHLVHVPAHLENQVSTVFDLIIGVLVTEPAALLLVEVEREAYTVVNPTLADLAQSAL